MTTELQSMAVGMPAVKGHPNRKDFRGVLTVVDMPSQKAPSGSNGRRVVLTRGAAEAALPSLLGMALDYAPSFDRHDVQRKVGVITGAEIVGRNLEVEGYLYAKDFPEVVDEIAKYGRREASGPKSSEQTPGVRSSGGDHRHFASGVKANRSRDWAGLRVSLAAAVEQIRSLSDAIRSRRTCEATSGLGARVKVGAGEELGMSFEVTNVTLVDAKARIWMLTGVTFTGAAILRRDKAAFENTWIELA